MISDQVYEKCLPLLQDKELDDDDRTEKVEDLIRSETSLTGKELENTVLDALWKFRASTNTGDNNHGKPPSRHTVIRRASPAPWQLARSSTPASPRPSTLTPSSSAIFRNRSSTASPFASPRASPRLAFVTPFIPNSPRLDTYQPATSYPPAHESTSSQELYGDMENDSVEWLVGDDANSNTSSSYPGEAGFATDGQGTTFMDPHDMLRSVFGENLDMGTIEKSLDEHGYDIAATLSTLMQAHGINEEHNIFPVPDAPRTVLIGKSMVPITRPVTPTGQQRSPIVCRYWLASGQCSRADCRFSHDTTGTVCKYWMQGTCLAGDACAFSHDPSGLVSQMYQSHTASPLSQPNLQDYNAFPTLQPAPILTSQISSDYALAFEQYHGSLPGSVPVALNPLASFTPNSASRNHSRTASRQQSRSATPSIPAVDDNDAFPTLGTAASAKKRHGKRGGHGHGNANKEPGSLADVVRSAPSPTPARRGPQKSRMSGSSINAAQSAILPPQDLPWVVTGDSVNKAYQKARAEAFKHANQRNKLLQGAAQAYNRHDARAAKALSLRGQAENNLMREAHREAAQLLYEERNSSSSSRELFIDLHGLHAEEAVEYLSQILRKHEKDSPMRPIYAITGTGHHSRNGRDKIGKAIKAFLGEWGYAYRDFATPGDRGMGGVIGVDPTSWNRALERGSESAVDASKSLRDLLATDRRNS